MKSAKNYPLFDKFISINKENIEWKRIDKDTLLLFNISKAEVIELNETGTLIFTQLSKKNLTFEEILNLILKKYDTTKSKNYKKECIEFISKLIKKKILTLKKERKNDKKKEFI